MTTMVLCPELIRLCDGISLHADQRLLSLGPVYKMILHMRSYIGLGLQDIGRPVARGGGGSGGSYDPPPPVAHPKDFVPPFSNFVPPFSNFVPPFSNFVPPFSNFVPAFSNFVPPFSNFVPPFSNFVPPLEYVDDVTRAMSKGGVLVNVQEWGRFSN